jgi:2-dehydro-3-deoxyphosphogluconate aldolase/(4S)-4-hydroxy-2-oxoglutarate aldolase
MNKSIEVFNVLKSNRLIALLSPETAQHCITAYEVLSPLGIVLEIAFRTEAAMQGLRVLIDRDPDALVLAGTVMTDRQAAQAIEAGAAGVVSADYIPAVVERCVHEDILCIPGGHGDVGKQLVQKAEGYGCDFSELREKYPYQWIHKLFPAVTGDLIYTGLAKAWKGPFHGLRIVYTGGVSRENVAAIAGQDPEGILCGSALTRHIDDPDRMAHEAREWISRICERSP